MDNARTFDERATRNIVRMTCCLVPAQYRRNAGVCTVENLRPFIARTRRDAIGENCGHFRPAISVMLRHVFRQTKAPKERAEEYWFERAYCDELTIGALIAAIKRRATVEKIVFSSFAPSPARQPCTVQR